MASKYAQSGRVKLHTNTTIMQTDIDLSIIMSKGAHKIFEVSDIAAGMTKTLISFLDSIYFMWLNKSGQVSNIFLNDQLPYADD